MSNSLPFGLMCAILFGFCVLILWTQIESNHYVRVLEDALDAQTAYADALSSLNHILRNDLEGEREYSAAVMRAVEDPDPGIDDCAD